MKRRHGRHGLRIVPYLIAAACVAPIAGADESGGAVVPAVRQAVWAEVEQRGSLQEPRAEGLGRPDWRTELQADASWRVDFGRRFALSVSPRVAWQEYGGSADGFSFSESADQRGEGEVSLRRAEASLSVGEWGLDLVAGKLRPQFGVNYVEPLSVMNLRGRDSYDEGQWVAGFLWGAGPVYVEAYGQGGDEAALYAAMSALLGVHEIGVAYRREEPSPDWGGGLFGAWFRTQVGDGIIPYVELAARSDSAFLDLDGQEERDLGWNWAALVGLGWAPSATNLSTYLEYRYLQAGYGEDDWERLDDAGLRAAGAYLPDFPYLQTSVHAIGVHLANQEEIAGRLSWSATCVYLFPDGLFAEAAAEARFVERCRVGLKLDVLNTLGGGSGRASSEPSLWSYRRRMTLYLNWKVDANEEAYDEI